MWMLELIRDKSDVATVFPNRPAHGIVGSEIVPPDTLKSPLRSCASGLLADAIYPLILHESDSLISPRSNCRKSFKMHFRKLTGATYVTFAEYANGEITLK